MPWQKGSSIKCWLLKRGWAGVHGHGHIPTPPRLWCYCDRAMAVFPHKTSLPSGEILVPLASSSSCHISAPGTDLHSGPLCLIFKDARHTDSEYKPNFLERERQILKGRENEPMDFFHPLLPLNCTKIKVINFQTSWI